MSDRLSREASLYIGMNLSSITQDIYPAFQSFEIIPIAWYFLFSRNDIITRKQIMDDETLNLLKQAADINNEDSFEKFSKEPVAFETTIPEAQSRLHKIRNVFESMPYFWSYFRIIEILERQLELQIQNLEESTLESAIPKMKTYHPDVAKSQVSTIDDPEIDDFGAEYLESLEQFVSINEDKSEQNDEDGLLSDFASNLTKDFGPLNDDKLNDSPINDDEVFGMGLLDEYEGIDTNNIINESFKTVETTDNNIEDNPFNDLSSMFTQEDENNKIEEEHFERTDKSDDDLNFAANLLADFGDDINTDLKTPDTGFGDELVNNLLSEFQENEKLPEDTTLHTIDDEFKKSELVSTSIISDDLLNDENLLAELGNITSLDTVAEDIQKIDNKIGHSGIYITLKFDHLAIENFGNNILNLFDRIESLYHHAIREEGKITRIMIDIFQEIFHNAKTDWKITGILSNDFRGKVSHKLGILMLGNPSEFNQDTKINFNTEFWTDNTLTEDDERLMFSLTKLPSEYLYEVINSGNIAEVENTITQTLIDTNAIINKRYSKENLALKPAASNIWSVRLLLPYLGEYKPATIICKSPNISWIDDFNERLDLPGVLNDWNIDYKIRLGDYSELDNYQIVFKRADGKVDTIKAFIRWLRRHHKMYTNKFGVNGIIQTLSKRLHETYLSDEAFTLFTVITNLSQTGFIEATNVLRDETILERISNLYSRV